MQCKFHYCVSKEVNARMIVRGLEMVSVNGEKIEIIIIVKF